MKHIRNFIFSISVACILAHPAIATVAISSSCGSATGIISCSDYDDYCEDPPCLAEDKLAFEKIYCGGNDAGTADYNSLTCFLNHDTGSVALAMDCVYNQDFHTS